MLISSIVKNNIILPQDLRIPAFLSKIPFIKTNLVSIILSFVVLILYVPFCFYIILKYFENTQTTEIIFFTGFLIGCLLELFRFLTLSMNLWQTFSNSLIFSGKMVLFGRTLTILSFACASLFSDTSQRQDVERNYIIMTTASIVFAALIPMNTAKISSNGLVLEGFLKLINIMRLILTVLVFISFYIHGIQKNNFEYKNLAFSFLILIAGYSLLVLTDSFLFLLTGTSLLLGGTYWYFKNLHKIYMWA
ncbi:hypothetical protein [Treponema sp.]|uniref:hypothetical protein n=1 Tax=Treponema sp. TaxID=166 RepID=UPI00388E8CDF